MQRVASVCIMCPDRPGIVAGVTDFLFRHHGNIVTLEEHTEDGFFFMRIEWELDASDFADERAFREAFASLVQTFSMTIQLDFFRERKRVGLFCSRELHCLVDILGRYYIGELAIFIPYIISNSSECREIAGKYDIPFFHVPVDADSGENSHETRCLDILREHPSDVIGLARYMRILSSDFIDRAEQKIINVHHSFLPSFVGAKPYEDAYTRGVKIIGATTHYVTPELDQGPIIEQRVKVIKHSHKIENLKLMGRECEKEAFAFALRKHIENKLVIFKNRVIVFE